MKEDQIKCAFEWLHVLPRDTPVLIRDDCGKPIFFTNTQKINMSFMIEQNKCFADPDIALHFQEVKRFV